jgi:hypothetical protein
MTGLRRWLQRPLDEYGRQRAFAIAAVLLMLAGATLSLTARPAHDAAGPPPRTSSTAAPTTSSPPTSAPLPPAALREREHERARAPRRVLRAGRAFLAGYLPYLYGRRPARQIEHTTAGLRRRLATNRPRVAPAARRRRPRVVALVGERVLERRGGWLLRARITDGDVAVYPIELLLEQHGQRLVVVQIGGE